MAKNFYDYLFAAKEKPEQPTEDAVPNTQTDAVVQDEAIGPWTHKYVVYCKSPKKEFMEELKAQDGVVAVFVKEKEAAPVPAEANPPNKK